MPEKSERKNQLELSSSITPILIVGNERLAPYIQVFSHQPENIVQHSLGCLFGIFKIDDTSVDSAFIVNFLVSEIKKEYYGNPRRTPASSFEAGLNRINIALSELAKQGNISWMGKLESAVCALEKNGMLHFSVTGKSHIALLREGSLSLISEGLTSESEIPNPLKTFTEISSGKLHPEDTLVLGSQEIFEFLPREKMERNARRFSHEEFARFLHTALVNEFDFCAAITAFLNKKTLRKVAKKPTSAVSLETIPNLWGANSFQRHNHSESETEKSLLEEEKDISASQTSESQRDGHLYIQQQHPNTNVSQKKFKESLLILREHIANITDAQWEKIQTATRQWRRALTKKTSSLPNDSSDHAFPETNSASPIDPIITIAPESEKIIPQEIQEQEKKISETPQPPILPEKRKKKVLHEIHAQEKPPLRSETLPQNPSPKTALQKKPKQNVAPKSVAEKLNRFPATLSKRLGRKEQTPLSNSDEDSISILHTTNPSFLETALLHTKNFIKQLHLKEKIRLFGNTVLPKIRILLSVSARLLSSLAKKMLSCLRRLAFRFSLLPVTWRIGIGAIFLLAFVIFFFATPFFKKTPPQPQQPNSNTSVTTESKEESIQTSATPEKSVTVYTSQNDILKMFSPENKILLVVEKNSVILISEGSPLQTFSLPTENGSCIDATYMDNLSLLFLLTEKGTLVSFSPVSKKFSSNNLTIGNVSPGKTFIGSYLTYLYIANTTENSIIRYPRAEGGFGTPTPWLLPNSGISLAGATDFFVNESVYITKQNSILRLSNKKSDPWALDTPSSSSTFSSLSVSNNAETIVVADTQKNKALLFSKSGTLQKEVALPESTAKFIGAILTDDGTLYARTDHEIRDIPSYK